MQAYNHPKMVEVKRKYVLLSVDQIDPAEYRKKYSSELMNTSQLPNLDVTSWAHSIGVGPLAKESRLSRRKQKHCHSNL